MEDKPVNKSTISSAIEDLFPGYFALVMATGIVSIAAFFRGHDIAAWSLLYLNILFFAVLSVMLTVRIVRFFPKVWSDITDHMRGPGFFTVCAGTCVLGSQLVIIAGKPDIAAVLWYVSWVFWAATMYTFFAAVTTREIKPSIDKGISGTWLIAAVATQAISVLGTLLADHFSPHRELVLFVTLAMYLVGCMLYLLLITLIFYRFTFGDLTSERMTPPYWINMGAVAITTLAGSRLIIAANGSELLTGILPFLKGFTLFFWSGGSWWIPLLFILGIWRHVYMRYPLRYDPQYWGLVFPLGMYTVCTIQLSKALNFEHLMIIPAVFYYIAVAAWLVAAFGMFHSFFASNRKSA